MQLREYQVNCVTFLAIESYSLWYLLVLPETEKGLMILYPALASARGYFGVQLKKCNLFLPQFMTSGNLYIYIYIHVPVYLPLETYAYQNICVASVLWLASVGPPTEPDITTTEFRTTSRCKLHEIDSHYDLCE